jgi:hypothetical protein
VTASNASTIGFVLGPCDEMRAEIFLRATNPEAVGGRLVGTITGPRRGRDTTLPTTTRLLPLPMADMNEIPAARAVLTEPAYWTPDLPNLYRVKAVVERPRQLRPAPPGSLDQIEMTVGLRRLGTRGRSFWLDGRRWVPRAVVVQGSPDMSSLKAAALGAAVAAPGAEVLSAADEIGLAVLPLVRAADITSERIGMLARHPAATLVVVETDTAADLSGTTERQFAMLRSLKGTLLLGFTADGSLPPPQTIAGVDFLVVVVPAGGLPHAAWRAVSSLPLVAWRRDAGDPVPSRAGCELLQRDLAAWGLAAGVDRLPWDWAGYLVG